MPRFAISILLVSVGSRIAPAAVSVEADVTLRAVQFASAAAGWAAGDAGAVLHTADGGRTWTPQPTGKSSAWTSLQMQNARRGILAGRLSTPAETAAGAVLLTDDAGETWISATAAPVTGVRALSIRPDGSGAAAAAAMADLSGLFLTADRGRTWNPIAGPPAAGWSAALAVPDATLLGGPRGLAMVRDKKWSKPVADVLPGMAVRAFAVGQNRIWAAGEGGQLFFSEDRGRHWRRASIPVPLEAARRFDFAGLSARGREVWAVGRPGSVVLHSDDEGATWTMQATGVSTPLEAVHFVSESKGWAVGAFGTILATDDGGTTWLAQRREGERAAILWIALDPADVPFSALARYGGDEGYLNVAVFVVGPDIELDPPTRWDRRHRAIDAVVAAGGSTAETSPRFPLPRVFEGAPEAAVLAEWNRRHEGKAEEELEKELALAIRLWRPASVVVCSSHGGRGGGAARLLERAAAAAFRSAAKPKADPDPWAALGIAPHAADKLYRATDHAPAAHVRHNANDIGPRLCETFADAAAPARSLVAPAASAAETHDCFLLIASHVAHGERDRRIVLDRGRTGMRRRDRPATDPAALEAARRRAERKRNVLAMAALEGPLARPEQLVAELPDLEKQLSSDQAGSILYFLAERFASRGEWQSAAGAMNHLLERHPQHRLADAALRWLLAYESSAEVRRVVRPPLEVVQGRIEFRATKEGESRATTDERRTELARDARATKRALEHTLALGAELHIHKPQFSADPKLQMLFAAAARRLGQRASAEFHLGVAAAADPHGPWAEIAERERSMLRSAAPPRRPAADCPEAAHRPRLDGKLADECWTTSPPITLVGPAEGVLADRSTQVWLCHDRAYFYLAARCQTPQGPPPAVERKARDEPLDDADRLELVLDVDRDYNTMFRFTVDGRGRAADDCWGDRTWNPPWFAAAAADSQGWALEIAIPRSEIEPEPSGPPWAIGIRRIVPDEGVLGLARAPADEPAAAMTHLRFVPRRADAASRLRAN